MPFTRPRALFGDDVFISYSRADGARYAAGLAAALAERRLSCHLDQWDSEPGAEIPQTILTSLRRSGLLVIAGTAQAGRSGNVLREIQEFLPFRRPVVPIDVDGSLRQAMWWHLVEGLPVASEPAGAPSADRPSADVLDRIEMSVVFRRRNRRLAQIGWATAAAFVALVAISLVVSRHLSAVADSTELARQSLVMRSSIDRHGALELAIRAGRAAPTEAARHALIQHLELLLPEGPPASDGSSGHIEVEPHGEVAALSTPDGKVLVIGLRDDTRFEICGSPIPVTGMWFSPDGKHLLILRQGATSYTEVIEIWDVKAERRVDAAQVGASFLDDLIFSPGGSFFVTSSVITSTQATLWSLPRGERIAELGRPHQFLFSPGGHELLTYPPGALWSLQTGRRLWSNPQRARYAITWAAFRDNGRRLVGALEGADDEASVRFVILTLAPNGAPQRVEWSSASQFDYGLLAGARVEWLPLPYLQGIADTAGRTTGVLPHGLRSSIAAQLKARQPRLVDDSACRHMFLELKSQLVLCVQSEEPPMLFALAGLDLVAALPGWRPGEIAQASAFSPDGTLLALRTEEIPPETWPSTYRLRVWDIHSRRMLWEIFGTSPSWLRFSGDGRRLFVGESAIMVHAARSGEPLARIQPARQLLWLDRAGAHAITRNDYTLALWNVGASRPVRTFDAVDASYSQGFKDRRVLEGSPGVDQLVAIATRRLNPCPGGSDSAREGL